MVLPGIQALFGFQLIAVFNARFAEDLSVAAQTFHLASIVLVVLSMALIMTPAALHRQQEWVSSARFVRIASRFVAWAMLPLLLAVALDVGLIALLILGTVGWAVGLGGLAGLCCAALWYLYPRVGDQHQRS